MHDTQAVVANFNFNENTNRKQINGGNRKIKIQRVD